MEPLETIHAKQGRKDNRFIFNVRVPILPLHEW